MFANSTTWRSKEEEQKGRAAIHASQVNRALASQEVGVPQAEENTSSCPFDIGAASSDMLVW